MTTNSLTILQALEAGAGTLKHAWEGVYFDAPPNPKFDAQILLAAALNKPAAYLFAHGSDMLDTDTCERFLGWIERRKQHEPVALILGSKAFFGRDFLVTSHTLIPRPETELLIETALPLITPTTLVLDLGTGSGAIGITLALESTAPVIATDISPEALATAQENARILGATERMSFLRGSLLPPALSALAQIPASFPLDHLLIAANLPYLTTHQWEALNANVKNFEPKTALVGGYNGLELYDELLMQLRAKRTTLPARITVLFEIDPSQHERLPRVIRAHFPAAEVATLADLAHLPRLVVASL